MFDRRKAELNRSFGNYFPEEKFNDDQGNFNTYIKKMKMKKKVSLIHLELLDEHLDEILFATAHLGVTG